MATLRHLPTGTLLPLAARHVIGRSRTCQLHLDLTSVSAHHAEITWDGRAWHLRDLNSRNGTFIAGERLTTVQQVMLEPGAEIGFGAAHSLYQFIDGSAPRLMASGPDGMIESLDDVLDLPSSEESEVTIYCLDNRWVVECPDGIRPIADEELIVVAGRPYHVHLPSSVLATRDADDVRGDALEDGVLELMVSRDGEHVDLCFRHGDRVHRVGSRIHNLLLLELARVRLTDADEAVLPESEHGWVHRDDLMKELELDDLQRLNLWVFRARRQLAQMKLSGEIIERREGVGQLRLGLRSLRIIHA